MGTRFVVLGDAALDVTVAPSRPPRDGGDVPAVIRLAPGGQGANVAVRLARLGAVVSLVAPVGSDAAGGLIGEALAADGVALSALAVPRTATVVALLDADGERTMLSDRQALRAAAVAAHLRGATWLHVSAYPLLDDEEGDELASLIGGRGDGTRLSVAGGSVPPEPALVSRFRSRLGRARPDLLVVSRDEAAALLGEPPRAAREAAAALVGLAPLVVATAGSQGSAAATESDVLEVPAASALGPVLDVTGAGDAYVAALLLTLAAADWPPSPDALRRAMEAGSRAGSLAARVMGAQAALPGERQPGARR